MRGKFRMLASGVFCGVAALVLPAVAGAAVGFPGPGYAGTSGAPTTSKPESKLWWNDGFWWASMFSKGQGAYTIHRLNLRTQRWVNTRVVIDTRDSTRQDVLSLGGKLFVASHKYRAVPRFNPGANAAADGMRLYRFSYNRARNRYTLDGSPHVIDAQRAEALVIERAGNGAIWATWVQEDAGGTYHVYVKGTGSGCTTGGIGSCAFGAAGILDDVGADDISSIVRFGSSLGIMWSDTPDAEMNFKVNSGSGWGGPIEVAASGNKLAEDHINLKADGGTVYVATKTKFTSSRNPGIRVLRRSSGGNWIGREVTNAGFRHTRPIVLLAGSRVYVFAQGGGSVFMKSAPKRTLDFRGGAGARVLSAGDPTSTKQNLNGRTQMIVAGSDHDARRYRHMYRQLASCINGNARSNTIVGTAGNDRLCGRGGNDVLKGLGGNDVLVGGSGRDRLVGGGGRDSHRGGLGGDTIVARDGQRDVVNGGRGRDRARVDGRDVRRSIEALF